VLFHRVPNLFLVSPVVAGTGDPGLPVLAAAAKRLLVLVSIAIAGPGLVRGPRSEALPRTSSVTTAPTVGAARAAT
jgi:hypothetical protein